MNIKYRWLISFSLITFFSLCANAEIYKWTDKDGNVRYTDTPPPITAKKIKTISGKKPTTNEVKPAVEAATPNTGNASAPAGKPADLVQDDIIKKRQQLADIEKQEKAQKEAEAKRNQENCAAARANYQTYSQGGRVYQTNEKGEREYLNDSSLAEKAAQAQRDIQQYCK